MANYHHYERLSAQDASFLAFEGPNTPMHVCGTAVHEVGSLAGAGGGLEIDRIRRYIDSRLNLIPRYRQRLSYMPVSRYPIWVDDESFNLASKAPARGRRRSAASRRKGRSSAPRGRT